MPISFQMMNPDINIFLISITPIRRPVISLSVLSRFEPVEHSVLILCFLSPVPMFRKFSVFNPKHVTPGSGVGFCAVCGVG